MARGSSVDDRVRILALRFAEDLTSAVRAGLADEVAAQVAAVLRHATRHVEIGFTVAGEAGDRRIGKLPVPVPCAVPRCGEHGIRAKRNFCAAHAASLTDAEKRAIREAQPARRERSPARSTKKSK